MHIKKMLLFATIIVFALGLTSCTSYRGTLLDKDNDDEIAEIRLQKIIEAIENKDKDALKSMFSINAVQEANDIDGGIDYIMDFYKGKFISKEGSIQRSDSNDHGKKTSELRNFSRVTTDNDKYIIFFVDKIEDTENPDNIGLYMIQIIKLTDREKYFDWGQGKSRCAGIFIPSDTNVEN